VRNQKEWKKESMAYFMGLFPPLGGGTEAKQENVGQITW